MVDPGPRTGPGSMNLDLDIEPTRPAPDPARAPARTGHRREYDAREPRRGMSKRVESMVRDVAAFRAIAQADLIKEQFGGHSYVRCAERYRGSGAGRMSRCPPPPVRAPEPAPTVGAEREAPGPSR